MLAEDLDKEKANISIVIPLYNEKESIQLLYDRIVHVVEGLAKPFEIIFIDDGSTDSSFQILRKIREKDKRVRIIKFRINAGKSKALSEGFKLAKGKIVFTMDADLQDDPNEIPIFLQKIEEGYDLVSGWKKKRHDPLEKRASSRLFNKMTSVITGLKIHDFNCGFKAYRKEVLQGIRVYGELHRYIPALAFWQGYKVGEIPVQHNLRRFGKSKYGWERYLRGFFDLVTVTLLTRYIRQPIHLFGIVGLMVLISGAGIIGLLTLLQLMYGGILGHEPLSYLGVLLILLGGQVLSLGLLAEYLVNLSQRKGLRKISIKRKVNFKNNGSRRVEISLVIPVHNEEGTLPFLWDKIKANLSSLNKPYEVLFIDDGSTDNSMNIMESVASQNDNVVIIELRKQFGKASALKTGFEHAKGDFVLSMDADLQGDPSNVKLFLQKAEDGYDLVMGRMIGVPFPRNIFLWCFNFIVSRLSGIELKDVGCGLRLIRRHILDTIELYGGLQYLLPIMVAQRGYRITHVDVLHQERFKGRSTYGLTRLPKAFLDLFTVVLITVYRRRPLHLFGSFGCMVSLSGFCICLYLTFLRLTTGTIQGHRTLLLMGVTFIILGLQWISTGLLSELINNINEEMIHDDVIEKIL